MALSPIEGNTLNSVTTVVTQDKAKKKNYILNAKVRQTQRITDNE